MGTSLIAANISAEQIIGMSGSGYVIGLGIASYEWMSALTLLIVGKFFLPIFLRNQIYTMPEFLQTALRHSVRLVTAVFWLALYVLVNLTAILWLGATAIHTVTGIDIRDALVALGAFAGAYALYGGLKAVALTDIVQVTLLVLGGLVIVYIALGRISGHTGVASVVGGFRMLETQLPGKFKMILSPDNPNYKDLPGLSVLIGGMWIMNLSYWGFNQYIIQRALAREGHARGPERHRARGIPQTADASAGGLPGIAAGLLAPHLEKPDMPIRIS